MSRRARSALVVALEESRTKPREWRRVDGTHTYSSAVTDAARARSVHQRGNILRGLVIEPGDQWDARVVVPPGRSLNDCAVWVMYLGSPDPSH